MPRVGRIYIEEGIFHIMARGNNKQPVITVSFWYTLPPFPAISILAYQET